MRTYERALEMAARTHRTEIAGGPAPFAHLSYEQELQIKRRAAAEFLGSMSEVAPASMQLLPLVEAPMPRAYRTTSRRRVWHERKTVRLVHGDGSTADAALSNALEPKSHLDAYGAIERHLNNVMSPLGSAMNHVIVRGTYEEHVLILNVRHLDAEVIRAARRCITAAQVACPIITSAWLYVDPSASRYYFEQERPLHGLATKKVLGNAAYNITSQGVTYQVGCFSFSQINLAMVPIFVSKVLGYANATAEDRVLDLYCGYGLFGAAFGKKVHDVVAIDADEATINNARYNIQRAGGKALARATMITPLTLKRSLPHVHRDQEVLVLDPPRSGTAKDVIATLGARKPRTVVHIFCGPEEIRRTIMEWKAAGYKATALEPMDMFPGTTGLEVLLGLQRA